MNENELFNEAIIQIKKIRRITNPELYDEISAQMAGLIEELENESIRLKRLSNLTADTNQPEISEIFFMLARNLEEKVELAYELRRATRRITNQ